MRGMGARYTLDARYLPENTVVDIVMYMVLYHSVKSIIRNKFKI
jgi:hypothetical protein